ncbi:class I adenylate-forming enzyme family protein [Novosphingobium sp. JCM 18896]|uniref:class I adenylate-forming enzyme family protein n=1 Tax=Novosphingobium sp. JCM 18896 TaxID=2989731 RepID=UPI0022232179|nr:AMP-binding protein [Novosphingobium sp. JCM 18896]MCW1428185.1 AMP-binding protein [Novosphingobium sp. JCM 18896]
MEDPSLSLVYGKPLAEEPGQGAQTIGGYLREVAALYGSREALVLRKGEHRLSWSYDDLLARSIEVAAALIASGVGRDSRVGILMTNRPEFLAALFGTALAGGVPVALSTFSTPSELDYLIKASQVSILLFEQTVLKKDFHAMIAELEPAIAQGEPGGLNSAKFPFLRHLVSLGGVEGTDEALESASGGAVETWRAFLARGADVSEAQVLARADMVTPGDIGGIFFSSGTTSLPKGIVHAQRAFTVQWWRWPQTFGMHHPVRAWTGNGFFWSGNVSMVLGSAFSTGGAVVLQRYFDAEEAIDLIAQEGVHFINGRPHQWARFQAAPNWAGADLSSVKYVPRGELIWEHPTVDTQWRVPNAFGCTETMTVNTGFSVEVPPEYYKDSFGAPLPGNLLKIVDPMTGAIVPRGTKGELCVKGPTLMMGYLGKTLEDCFDAQGFFCTGDGGHVDEEGRFFWQGRLTDMIKTGGANVSPLEVDEVCARFHGIKRVQTVGVPDDLLGEMVVTCIVPVDGVTLDESAIVAFLKTEIASFKIPRRVLFFTDEDCAVTGSEKVKPALMRELAARTLGVAPAVPAGG